MIFEVSYDYCLISIISFIFFLFSICDIRKQRIPNVLMILTIIPRVILSLVFHVEYEITLTTVLLNIGISFFFLILLKKNLLGAADVKMILLIMFYLEEVTDQKFLLLFFIHIWIQLIIIKFTKKNKEIPLAPVFFLALLNTIVFFEFLGFF